MDFAASASERQQFQPIVEWVDRLPVAPGARNVAAAGTASRSGLRVVINPTSSLPSFR
jgi:hypothetical protein